MKSIYKIILLLFSLHGGWISGQPEFNTLPITNKFLINPSFAGLNENTTMFTGLQLVSFSKKEHNHNYFMTYDSYSKKLKGGIAINIFQYLYGESNTTSTGGGFTYTKPIYLKTAGKIIPSLKLNYFITNKQWFVFLINNIVAKNIEKQQFPKDNKFKEYNTFSPQLSILWDANSFRTGITSSMEFRHSYSQQNKNPGIMPANCIFYLSKKFNGLRKGLISQNFQVNPELTILFSPKKFVASTGLRLQFPGHISGIFAYNDLTRQLHGITGVFGWKLNNLHINLSAGGSFSPVRKQASLHGEMSVGFIIPSIQYNERSPWEPSKRSFEYQ